MISGRTKVFVILSSVLFLLMAITACCTAADVKVLKVATLNEVKSPSFIGDYTTGLSITSLILP